MRADMLKILAAILLAMSIYAGSANARGGGGAETMPGTNYTDMPDYRPKPVERRRRLKPMSKHGHRLQGSARGD